MNKSTVAIQILGKAYHIKCPEHEVMALKKAAQLVDEKMRKTLASMGNQSHDKIAILTSLQLAHQIQTARADLQQEMDAAYTRLETLAHTIEEELANKEDYPHVSEE